MSTASVADARRQVRERLVAAIGSDAMYDVSAIASAVRGRFGDWVNVREIDRATFWRIAIAHVVTPD